MWMLKRLVMLEEGWISASALPVVGGIRTVPYILHLRCWKGKG